MGRRIDRGVVAMCAVACGGAGLLSVSGLGILDMWEAWFIVFLATLGGATIGAIVELARMRNSADEPSQPHPKDEGE